jgi:2,3-dihydroxy-p-cumate/2,3-dihydroxybenzoate 3,4-dioxygenase
VIELTDIAYVRTSTPNLEESVRFAVDVVGLEVSARDDRAAYLRCDQRHHFLALVEGAAGMLACGLSLPDLAHLESAERELANLGIRVQRGTADEAAARRVEAFIAFDDPAGNRIELVVNQFVLGRAVRFGRDAGISEFGHVCLDAAVPRDVANFWTTVFSAQLSDRIGDAAYLLRIDPVHHKLAIFASERPGLCHVNLQVTSLDHLMRNWHFLQSAGVEIQSGPGRHPTSEAIFVYFTGPQNLTYEYSFGVKRIEAAGWRPRVFPLEELGSIDMWEGPTKRPTSQPQGGVDEPSNGVGAGLDLAGHQVLDK